MALLKLRWIPALPGRLWLRAACYIRAKGVTFVGRAELYWGDYL